MTTGPLAPCPVFQTTTQESWPGNGCLENTPRPGPPKRFPDNNAGVEAGQQMSGKHARRGHAQQTTSSSESELSFPMA